MTAILMAALLLQAAHEHHVPRSAEEYAKILEQPSRDEWQKPEQVIEALQLRKTDVVADLGAGSGYFTRRLATRVDKVYAVDIDRRLLDMITKSNDARIQAVLATPDDPKLPPHSVDVVFICEVLHHIENRGAYYPKLIASLKPNGRIIIVDFQKRPLPVGPNVEMKIDEKDLEKELSAAGLKITKRHTFLPYQYFVEAMPR